MIQLPIAVLNVLVYALVLVLTHVLAAVEQVVH